MKKITASIALLALFAACKKTEVLVQNEQPTSAVNKKPSPPTSANPVFAYQDYKKINNQLTVPAIYVMDVTGANVTAVYTNYSGQGNNAIINRPDYPAWSPDGTKLCFTLNEADLYTLNISIVNGVATGSGATKIGDGVAAGGTYKQGKWRPGASQIACVWKKSAEPDKIHLLGSTGGTATVLYAAVNTDWVIEDDIAFRSDGSHLVFSERQISTAKVFLKVLDLNSNSVIKSIDLSQYKSIREMDWGKTSGSNIVAITTVPYCDGTQIGTSGIHQLQTIDVSASSPSLTLIKNDEGNICWAPGDQQIGVAAGLARVCGASCCSSQYIGKGIYTIATNTYTLPSYYGGNHHDWKR